MKEALEERKRIEKALDSLNYLRVYGFVSDAEDKKIIKRIHVRCVKQNLVVLKELKL